MKKCGILLNGIFFSLKEASTWLKLEDIMLSEISQSQKDKYLKMPYDVSEVTAPTEAKGRLVVTEAGGGGKREPDQ